MGFLKFILWTSCAIAIGIGLSTWKVDGRTPLEHGERAWKSSNGGNKAKSFATDVGEHVEEALESAKDTLGARNPGPRENHSEDDRAAVEQLISQRSKKK